MTYTADRTLKKSHLHTRCLNLHLSLNLEGRLNTTYDFTTSFLHFSLFLTALSDMANSKPFHSLMLSSHLLLCLPCLLHFTVPCKMVLARSDERETCPYHFSLRLFTIVRSVFAVNTTFPLCARRLFESFPEIREQHFKHFAGMPDDVMKTTGVGRAHAMAVLTGISAFVSSLEDQECLEGLTKKLVRNHIDRKIGASRFQVCITLSPPLPSTLYP